MCECVGICVYVRVCVYLLNSSALDYLLAFIWYIEIKLTISRGIYPMKRVESILINEWFMRFFF